MKTIKDLKEDWKGRIINEATIQKQIADNEGIEFSMTGELIPLEIVEGDLKHLVVERIKSHLKYIEDFLELIEIGAYSECVWKDIDKEWDARGIESFAGKVEELVELFNITDEDLEELKGRKND